MGSCCTSINTKKILIVPQPLIGMAILKEYTCIWFDPNSSGNLTLLSTIQVYFKSIQQVETSQECFASVGNAKKRKQPLFIISCGSKYDEIKDQVQDCPMVDMIVIFCLNTAKHLHYQTEHRKVIAVISTTGDLRNSFEKAIQEGTRAYQRFLRKFIGHLEQRSCYLLGYQQDEELIKNSVGVLKDSYEGKNIFYPLSFEAYKIKDEKSWKDSLASMNELNANCDFHWNIKEQREHAKEILEEIKDIHKLSGKPLQEAILKSYTEEGLCYLLNYCMRTANPRLLNGFAEYGYLLRGSMFMLGIPATETGCKKVYRGLTLQLEQVKHWKRCTEKYVLTPQYTSTTMSQGIAEDFMKKRKIDADQRRVLMDITFTEDREKFVSSLGILKDLYNGIYFPVNIQAYSAYPQEQEILFPPFYPMYVKAVTQNEDYTVILELEVPSFLSFGKMREGGSWKRGGKPLSKEVGQAIRKRSIELIEKNLMEVVDLQGCFTEDQESVKSFNDLMKICAGKRITALNLSLFSFFEKSSKDLLEEFITSSIGQLTDLRFLNCGVSDESAAIIAKSLSENSRLQKLQLGHNKITDDGMKALADAIANNKTLASLDLCMGRIGEDGARAIGEALGKTHNLVELDLSDNELEDEGAKAIAEGIESNRMITILKLFSVNMGAEAGKALAKGLAKNTALIELDLSMNPIGPEAGKDLTSSLQDNYNLAKINLGAMKLGNEAVQMLAPLIKKTVVLKELQLYEDEIGPSGGVALAEALKKNKSVTLLSLDDNDLEEGGARALGEMLGKNSTLEKLYLSKNGIGTPGCAEIARGLIKNHCLKVLGISSDHIGDAGAKALGMMLALNRTLSILFLRSNEIRDSGGKALAEGMKKNEAIKEVSLYGNDISAEIKKEIKAANPMATLSLT